MGFVPEQVCKQKKKTKHSICACCLPISSNDNQEFLISVSNVNENVKQLTNVFAKSSNRTVTCYVRYQNCMNEAM